MPSPDGRPVAFNVEIPWHEAAQDLSPESVFECCAHPWRCADPKNCPSQTLSQSDFDSMPKGV